MKILKSFTSLLLVTALMFSVASCVIVSGGRHDNGLHKGWYKNSGNGNAAGKGKGKGH